MDRGDTLGRLAADLRSDIAAEAPAKITYERLIKVCDDAELKDTLTFLMSREVAHRPCPRRPGAPVASVPVAANLA